MASALVDTADLNLIELLNKTKNKEDLTMNPLQLMQIDNKYYDTDKISGELAHTSKSKVKVLHHNIRSLPDKFDHLKIFLANTQINPDIILLCETFLNGKNENLYQLPDYQFISKCRANKTCGGVGMYIKNDLSYKIRNELAPHIEGSFESIFIEILDADKRMIVGEIYRAPNTSVQTAIDNYEKTISNINTTNLDSIIGTDQNIDYMKINDNKKTQDLLNVFFNNNYVPTIFQPTRITQNTSTLIDNIYLKTTKNNPMISGVINTDLSDHFPIFLCINTKTGKHKPKQKIKSRLLNDDKLNLIQNELSKQNWNNMKEMQTNEAHVYFTKRLNTIMDKIAPEKILTLNRRNSPKEKWMTKGLLKSTHTKEKLYKKSLRKEKIDIATSTYIRYRNKYNHIQKIIKAKYYADALEANKHDIRKTWQIMKSAMNKQYDKTGISKIINYENNTLTDQEQIANAFCTYFSNVGQAYANKIPITTITPDKYLKNKQLNSIFLSPTDSEEIYKIINNLKTKNSSGHDNIC